MSTLPRTPSTSPAATTPSAHPEVLQDVVLRLERTIGDPIVARSKVLDIEPGADGDLLVVSCPPGLDRRQHHLEAQLTWTYPLGRMECAVTTRPAARKYGDVWLVQPHGPTTRVQQRQYFRASLSVPVRLTWRDAAEWPDDPPHEDGEEPCAQEQQARGMVIDLSEGGLLATLAPARPGVGAVVEVTMTLDDGEDGEVTASAMVVREVAFAGGAAGVAVAFNDPTEHGDRLRRLAFEAERRRRRTA